jgi:hypothetical protein
VKTHEHAFIPRPPASTRLQTFVATLGLSVMNVAAVASLSGTAPAAVAIDGCGKWTANHLIANQWR